MGKNKYEGNVRYSHIAEALMLPEGFWEILGSLNLLLSWKGLCISNVTNWTDICWLVKISPMKGIFIKCTSTRSKDSYFEWHRDICFQYFPIRYLYEWVCEGICFDWISECLCYLQNLHDVSLQRVITPYNRGLRRAVRTVQTVTNPKQTTTRK